MRKNTLLATVAALGLLGATSFAAAQAVNQGAAQPPAVAAPAGKEPSAKEPATKQPAQTQTNAPAAPGAKPGPSARDQTDMPKQPQGKPGSDAQPKSAESPPADTKGRSAADNKAGSAPDTKTSTTGSAPAGKAAAAPPPEKRSQITTAIKREKITETKNVNFNITIGSRVPSTVTFYPLPTRIVEIYPEWSGYQVILVNGRYVVVRPQTYEIVYIIEG